MKHLAILIALGWFWLTFYSVGPLTTWTQVAVGGLTLAVGCLVAAFWGTSVASRRRPR